MKNKIAKELGYDSKGWMYLFIPVFVDTSTYEVIGRNFIADAILELLLSIDVFSDGYHILITGTL